MSDASRPRLRGPTCFIPCKRGDRGKVADALHREGLSSRAHDVEPGHTLGSIRHLFSPRSSWRLPGQLPTPNFFGRVLSGEHANPGKLPKTFSALASQRVAHGRTRRG